MADGLKMITPALTKEEWEQPVRIGGKYGDLFLYASRMSPKELHQLAALALYGTPEGFTRGDVELLRRLARYAAEAAPQQGEREDDDATPYFQAQIDAAHLANRISALLPPEDINASE